MERSRIMKSHRTAACAVAVGLLCSITSSVRAEPPGPVVFSEIMWMGSTASSSDEWVELFNRSRDPVDLSGWVITRLGSDGETVEMLRLDPVSLAAGDVFLVANYSDGNSRTVLGVTPGLVSSAVSLSNSKLQVRLYDAPPEEGGRLIDTADDGSGAPFAGDGTLKQAMVRIDFEMDGTQGEAWVTAVEAAGWQPGASELGTPGSIPARLLPASPPPSPTAVPTMGWAEVKTSAGSAVN
jgi:hypothetical protein